MTLFSQYYPAHSAAFYELVRQQVQAALDEDVGSGDLTALLVPPSLTVSATIVARENAIICGLDWVNACFKQIDTNVDINWLIIEGQQVKSNQVLCEIHGLARALLTSERCALNFLQTLSATSTETRKYVEAIAWYAVSNFRYPQNNAPFKISPEICCDCGWWSQSTLSFI